MHTSYENKKSDTSEKLVMFMIYLDSNRETFYISFE